MNSLTKILIAAILIALLVGANHIIAQTWTSLNGPQITKNVKDISLSGDVGYIAENDYVQKSTNGGTGWFVTATPYSAPSFVLVKPDDAMKVVAAKNGYLHYNSQGGNSTWDPPKIYDPNLIPLRLIAAVNDNNVMLLGRMNNITGTNSIWRSFDGGASWNAVTQFNAPTDINDFSAYPRTGDGIDRDQLIIAGGSAPIGSTPQGLSKSSPAINAGLWKSTNYGQTWEEFGMGNTNVRSVAVIPKSSTTPYIRLVVEDISGNNDIVSRDATLQGNWTTVFNSAADVHMVRVKPANNYVFIASSNGVYRSINEGITFTQQNSGLGTDINVISIAVTNAGNTVIAGTANSLYRSTNNGDSWTEVGKMNASSLAANGGTVWSVTRDNNYSGKNVSSNWTNYTIGNTGGSFRSEHVLSKSSTDLFVAGALNNAASLFRSINSGDSYFQVAVSSPLPTSGKFLGTVKNPANNEMWLYGGGSINGTWRMLLKSTDGGGNWNIMSPYWQAADQYVNDLIVLNVGSGRLFAALSDGKVYRSDDNGGSWSSPAAFDMGEEIPVQAVAANPQQPSIVYACGNKGLWRSASYGDAGSWIRIRTDNVKRILIHPSYNSTNYLWVVAAGGNKIFRTKDGGSNWIEVNTDIISKPIYDIRKDIVNDSLMYIATAGGVHKINPPPESPTNLVGSVENNRPKITWDANIETDLKQTGTYEIYRYFRSCEWVAPKWYCGSAGPAQKIAATSNTYYVDNTQTIWSGPPSTDILVREAGYYVKAVDKSNVVSENSNSVEFLVGRPNVEYKTVVSDNQKLPDKFELGNNHPNPFNPTTVIHYGLPEDAHVVLKVYDVLGREWATIINEFQQAGYKSVQFDASNLTSGVYIYRLQAGKFHDVKKMILMR